MNLLNLYNLFKKSSGISTDSRKIAQNCMFFALKGEHFNGNLFALQALKQGALYAIIEADISKSTDVSAEEYHQFLAEGKIILVENVLKTLQKLATHHRKQLIHTKILAIGGSNGKTTTKELIYRVLSTTFRTFATLGNFNNHIGVPLTLLQIPQDCEIAVIEMGANHPQEIADLCEIALPDFGVITNIGFDHLEGFGSIEGVAKANGELFDFLAWKNNENKQGIAFINTFEPFLKQISQNVAQIYTYPQPEDYFTISQKERTFFVEYSRGKKENDGENANESVEKNVEKNVEKTLNKNFIKTQLFGKHNFYNIATALCVGKFFGVDDQKADHAITQYSPTNNRSQIIEKSKEIGDKIHKNTIILDAYNANPSSMKSALEAFANMEIAQKKVIILGEMLEMGEHSPEMHENLGKLVKNLGFEQVILYGNDMQYALLHLPQAYYFTDKFSLHNWLADKNYTNTHFLIKGSRGAKLETVLEFL